MKFLGTTLAIFLAATSLTAQAEEEAKKGLSGSGEAGFSSSTGNTNEEAAYAALKLNYIQETYKLKGLIEANNKKEDSIQTKERYVGDFQGDLFFSDYQKAYGFGQARWEHDKFEAIELNSYYIAGLGYNFFNTEKMILAAEAGAGYQKNDFTNESDNSDLDQGIVKLFANFEYQLNDNIRFLQDLNEFYGQKQAKFESNTSFQVALASNLNLKATYKYRHNTAPADGKVKDDTETLFTLIYNF